MRDVTWWKVVLAFVLTFVGIHGFAAWRGPLAFYDTGMYSVPQYTLPSAGLAFLLTLFVNGIRWVVILLPSGTRLPAPA